MWVWMIESLEVCYFFRGILRRRDEFTRRVGPRLVGRGHFSWGRREQELDGQGENQEEIK